MIDIAITATHRPQLLERTLTSFHKHLWSSDTERLRCVINVDPVGSDTDRYFDVLEVCSKYFSHVKINRAERAHFPTAIKWLWDNIESDLFFNLEEDWELLEPVDWHKMLREFHFWDRLAHLRLSFTVSTRKTCKQWTHFAEWNGRFFQWHDEDKRTVGWCGHPSLNRTSFIKEAMKHIDFEHNPEKQIKGHYIEHLIKPSVFGVFIAQNQPRQILDTGRQWMVDNGYIKKGNKAWFTQWEKTK